MEKVLIIDDDQEKEFDLLFTVDESKGDKYYIAYTDLEDPKMPICAALYDKKTHRASYIEDENEQETIYKIIEALKEKIKNQGEN